MMRPDMQLAVVKTLSTTSDFSPIGFDMSLLAPFGERMERALSYQAGVANAVGQVVTLEIQGQADIADGG